MATQQPLTKTARNQQETLNHSQDPNPALKGRKFMLTLRDSVYGDLEKAADRRGVTIQGLIRAVIVPEWQREQSSVIQVRTDLETTSIRSDDVVRNLISAPSGMREPRYR